MSQTPFNKESNVFRPGITVRIQEGPFKDFLGKIIEVDQSTQRVKTAVNFFGKEIQSEFNYSQITPDPHTYYRRIIR